MTSLLTKRLQALLSVLSVLVLAALLAVAIGFFLMRGSLPQLEGERPLSGLSAPVKIERDALGVPRITAATRVDAARALGFLHAQDRFFQMDLLRRRGAGELAELFGDGALAIDRQARRHGFRRLAGDVIAALPPPHRAVLDAYVEGVNAGLTSLARKPWEYYVLRTEPAAWTAADSVLCVYAMWFDLQDDRGHYELSTRALFEVYGQSGLGFFAPRGTSQDAPLDGTQFPTPELPPVRLKRDAASARLEWEEAVLPGSNSFAVAGTHTASGAAMLANDPHLGLAVPNVWYRVELRWHDERGEARRVVGGTLPGGPAVIIGSNGNVAWGYTNSQIDTVDVVIVETFADVQYRTPQGWRDIEDRVETIRVKGGADVEETVRWTEFGPLIGPAGEGRSFALRWTAHARESANLEFLALETARSTADAVAIAPRIGMPNQNLLAADTNGVIAWTLTGKIPRRVGYDGRLPVSWAFGDRRWEGWLPAEEVPVISQPADGLLWTANNRIVGGAAYATLGDGGYANGFRAIAIRDDLRELAATGKKLSERDLLGVQLDDRARFLERWRELLLSVLTDDAVAATRSRAEFRELAREWSGRAAIDSVSYRLVRGFRQKVMERALAPFAERPQERYEHFNFNQFLVEDSVWRLVSERPERLLAREYATWDALLLAAVDDVIEDAKKEGVRLKHYTWGARNTLRMRHPFARFIPAWMAGFLNMPAQPLPGDGSVPRVQTPGFGASKRLVVTPGREENGIFHMPGGQSGHPLSAYFRAGHDAWAKGEAQPLLPGAAEHTLTLVPH